MQAKAEALWMLASIQYTFPGMEASVALVQILHCVIWEAETPFCFIYRQRSLVMENRHDVDL